MNRFFAVGSHWLRASVYQPSFSIRTINVLHGHIDSEIKTMKKISFVFSLLVLSLASALPASAQEEAPAAKEPTAATKAPAAPATNPQVVIETSMGTMVVELFADKAPKTVENFLGYVASGFYEGTIFHRIIPKFMIQGGGFTSDLVKKANRAPVQNEADNGLTNQRGTLAMARTGQPHSATSQFFINTVDNDSLNHSGKNARGWGYAVFGKVVEGMDVIDALSAVKTGTRKRMQDVPFEAVTIKKIAVQ